MEHEGSLCIHKHPTPTPILSQIIPVHASPSLLLNIHYHYRPPIYAYIVQVFSFPQCPPSSPKPRKHVSCLPYVLHAPPISFFFIWSPE